MGWMDSSSKRIGRTQLRTMGPKNALPNETTPPLPNGGTPLNLLKAKIKRRIDLRAEILYDCPLIFFKF